MAASLSASGIAGVRSVEEAMSMHSCVRKAECYAFVEGRRRRARCELGGQLD